MTKEQQQTIERLRNMGLGYRKIGIALDLPRDKVRNYCKANGLDGYAILTFFSFNKIGENHKEKILVKKVTVVVALDLGTGNTKNPDNESG